MCSERQVPEHATDRKDEHLSHRTQIGTWDDKRIYEGIALANIPTLLMLLVQTTGNLKWLEEPYRPTPTRGLSDHNDGGLAEDLQNEIRNATFDALIQWHRGRPLALPRPPHDLLVKMMSVCMGEPVAPEYGPLLESELRFADAPVIQNGPGKPKPYETSHQTLSWPQVLIVGAGVSGIIAAVRLQQAGIPFLIVEKHDSVGGTWFRNRYPGCGVDTPSHYYSLSFAPYDWAHYFAGRDEVYQYLSTVVTHMGLQPYIRLNTEVTNATYRTAHQSWQVILKTDHGYETIEPNIIISAVGAFAEPKYPDIPGLDRFQGRVYHTADWPSDADLENKRVGVIGTGASAMQLVPAIANHVQELTIFQRTPQWAAPFEYFHKSIPEPLRYLLQTVPLYRAWYRLRLNWVFTDKIHPSLQKDPNWPHPDRAVNAINDGYRRFLTRYIASELGQRTDLMDSVLPDYPPFGKRILLDNGWYRTLTKDNVHLVTSPIQELTIQTVKTTDDRDYPIDAIVLATGFNIARFVASMEIYGKEGVSLRNYWHDDDPRAYMGCAVASFPNFFMLYGPNTQTAGGSLMFMIENQMEYIFSIIEWMIRDNIGSVEVRTESYQRFAANVDKAHETMIWTHPGFTTYYRNDRGRVVVVNPYRMVDYWKMCRELAIEDFYTESRKEEAETAALTA